MNKTKFQLPALHIVRFKQTALQTQSDFFIKGGYGKYLLHGVALELRYNNNSVGSSSIPAGAYDCVKMNHSKFGNCMYVKKVSKRTGILIHAGNFYFDTRGCILLGSHFEKINSDFELDAVNSVETLSKAYALLPINFKLIITKNYK